MRENIKGQPSVLKKLNQTLIIDILRAEGPMSRADLARRTTLSPPTISRLVSDMTAAGLLEEAGPDTTTAPGRTGMLYQFRSDFAYCIGIHVGQLKIRGAIANMDASVLHTVELPSHTDVGELVTVNQVIQVVKRLITHIQVPLGKVRGVVIAVPGVVHPSSQRIVDAPHIYGWRNFALADHLSERLPDIPLSIRNDINLAIVGEQWLGAAHDVESALFVSYQTGIGCGILLNGQLYESARGTAGEIGFMTVSERFLDETAIADRHPSSAHSSGYGWGNLEKLAGGPALIEKARAAIREGVVSSLASVEHADGSHSQRTLNLEHIFLGAAAGDALARTLVTEACRYVGMAVANAVALLDPDRVIIGGDATLAGEYVTAQINEVVHRLIPFPVKITSARLGSQASAYGALVEARDIALNKLVSRHEIVAQ